MNDPGDVFSSFNYFDALFTHGKQNAVLIMGADGVIKSISPAFTLSFGYAPKDIVGKHMTMLYTAEDRSKAVPENELRTVLRDGRSSDNNYLVNSDRSVTWVAGESVRVKNDAGEYSILKVIVNIHRQKVSENELRELHQLNEDILGSIEDVVIALDERFHIVKTNKAFDKLFKKDDTEFVKFDITEFAKSFDINNQLPAVVQNAVKMKKGFTARNVEMTTAVNEKKIFDVTCTPIRDPGQHMLVILHDTTVHREIEREREDIIGFVAHELRNPLANVVLCNEIMNDAIRTGNMDELEELLQRSKNNVMRLHKMIGQLYDATKASSGNIGLEISTFHFGDMVREAVDTVQALQPAYHIVVRGDGNITINGDRYQLIQVVTNYLSNGIKYSDGKTEVILHIQYDEDSVTVSVKDEGMGIPAHQLPYIFDRFFRAEKTSGIEGVGLGLYLCSQIIRAHKGQVWTESEEKKGSVFYFSIPRSLPAATNAFI